MPSRKPYAPPIPTESAEQICLFRWTGFQMGAYPELEYLYHVPNGGHRNKATAGRLKAEGVKAGVPDLCLPVPRGGFHGLYIEMKRAEGGRESEEQKRWIAFLSRQGYYTTICNGWEPASLAILNYLKMEQKAPSIAANSAKFNILRGIVAASLLPKQEKRVLSAFITEIEEREGRGRWQNP